MTERTEVTATPEDGYVMIGVDAEETGRHLKTTAGAPGSCDPQISFRVMETFETVKLMVVDSQGSTEIRTIADRAGVVFVQLPGLEMSQIRVNDDGQVDLTDCPEEFTVAVECTYVDVRKTVPLAGAE